MRLSIREISRAIQSLVVVTLCVASNAAIAQTWDIFVLEQLRCEQDPSPGPIIQSLSEAGAIDVSANLGYDSTSCFRIKGTVEIAGLKVNSVCGFEEDSEQRARYPDIFYRGPGTSPGPFISFGTSANDDVVAQWYFDNIGTRHLNEAISSEWTNIGDRTEVACSSWFSG